MIPNNTNLKGDVKVHALTTCIIKFLFVRSYKREFHWNFIIDIDTYYYFQTRRFYDLMVQMDKGISNT